MELRGRLYQRSFSSFVLLFLSLLLLTAADGGALRYVIRNSTGGSLRGFTQTVLGRDVDTFLGVPYATPPVGNLRFQRPLPADRWTNVRNATQLPSSCYQFVDTNFDRFRGVEMWNPNTKMSEDCLYLNIWQPMGGHSSHTKKAVMAWIYGGSYNTGTSTLDLYDAKFLASQGDVVVVSMQYRIGPLGFLYLGTADASGNQGSLDQNLALQWIHDNIGHFGGDPERVTVFGESAGAHSASLHLISPLSKHLVKSGIMQSAAASAYWGVDAPSAAKSNALDLAALVGCPSDPNETDRVLRCLKAMDAHKISNEQLNVSVKIPVGGIFIPFIPTLDNNFLKEYPWETLRKEAFDRKHVLLGVNREEGMYFLAYTFKQQFAFNADSIDITADDYKDIVRKLLQLDVGPVVESIAFEYGAPYEVFKDAFKYRKLLDDVIGDVVFKCPVVDFARAYAKRGTDAYVYQFNHRTSANPWPLWMGVMHGYEIDHVFGMPLDSSLNYTEAEKRLSRQMITYWTNFAKSGNPNMNEMNASDSNLVNWPTYQLTQRKVLHLDATSLTVENGLRDRQCDYWRTIVPKLRDIACSRHNSASQSSSSSSSSNLLILLFVSVSSSTVLLRSGLLLTLKDH